MSCNYWNMREELELLNENSREFILNYCIRYKCKHFKGKCVIDWNKDIKMMCIKENRDNETN